MTQGRKIDLTGRVFGRLTVVREDGRICGGLAWLCRCSCGKEARVMSANLCRGRTASCGCLARDVHRVSCRDIRRTHSASRHPLFRLWHGMLGRCERPNHSAYPIYGGRGVKVCEEWHDPWKFFADVGERPGEGYSLDRIDNDGHYEPGNVRWADRKTQMRNCRRNRRVEANGESLTIAEWAERLGADWMTIWSRLKAGWPAAEAVTRPVERRVKRTR